MKREAEGADRLPRGTLPSRPSSGRGAGVRSSLVLLCWTSNQRCSPSSPEGSCPRLEAKMPRGGDSPGLGSAAFAISPEMVSQKGVFASAAPGSSPAAGAELSPGALSPAQPRRPLAPAGASLAPRPGACGHRERA